MSDVAHCDEIDSPQESFVLGAGFSRAISECMPLTDDVGRRLIKDEPVVFGSIGSGSFETWLSQRAEPQPYLNSADNLSRQALFAEATRKIALIIDEYVDEALRQPIPPWLAELLAVWHLRQSHVLTFNYDTLIETAFVSMDFWDWRRGSQFQWGSLINYNPTGKVGTSIGEAGGSTPPHASFRLWKLHGSTNWFSAPGDTSGASATRGRLPGVFGDPRPVAESERHWVAPGRERLIVPPSAIKAPYYGNPVTREAWLRGYEAICASEVLTLIGYSMPPADLTSEAMIFEAVVAGAVREVRVVDRDPDQIASRLRDVLPAWVKVTVAARGDHAVAEYVSSVVTSAAFNLVERLRDQLTADPEARICVSWGDIDDRRAGQVPRTAAVLDVIVDDDGVAELVIEALTYFEHAARARNLGRPMREASAVTASELSARLVDAREVRVRVEGSTSHPRVIAMTRRSMDRGAGLGQWILLVPAGCAPEPMTEPR